MSMIESLQIEVSLNRPQNDGMLHPERSRKDPPKLTNSCIPSGHINCGVHSPMPAELLKTSQTESLRVTSFDGVTLRINS